MSLIPFVYSWVPALPALLCCTCLQLHHPWNLAMQELETPLQSPFLLSLEIRWLRCVLQPLSRSIGCSCSTWMSLLQLVTSCHPLHAHTRPGVCRGWLTENSLCQACSMVSKAGQGFLPKRLLNNRFCARNKISVILKQDDNYFSRTPQLSRSGPMASLLPALQEQLGLSCVPMKFLPDERPSSAQQQQASKRKKGGKRNASGDASPVPLGHSVWWPAMFIYGEDTNLPKPFLVKTGLLFAVVVHTLSTLHER